MDKIVNEGSTPKRLIEYAREIEAEGGKAFKLKKGWRLVVGDLVLEFLQTAPKLLRQLAKTLEKRNLRIEQLEAELANEKMLRQLAEQRLRDLEEAQKPQQWPWTYPQPYAPYEPLLPSEPIWIGGSMSDWTYTGNTIRLNDAVPGTITISGSSDGK